MMYGDHSSSVILDSLSLVLKVHPEIFDLLSFYCFFHLFDAGGGVEPQHIYFVLRPISQMYCYTDTYKLQKGKDKSKNRTKIKN